MSNPFWTSDAQEPATQPERLDVSLPSSFPL